MTITSESLIAMAAIVGLLSTGLGVYVHYAVRAALLAFESRFFERLNGRYIRREVCEERHGACRAELGRRLMAIEDK